MKQRKRFFIPMILAVSIIVCVILATPTIETHTWVLSSAQQAEPLMVVAHHPDLDVSDEESPLFGLSKPIELICEAKDGKLILTDKTNHQTYEGIYTVKSRNKLRYQSYTVVINGVEGTANISSRSGRTLFMSVGGYYLDFKVE